MLRLSLLIVVVLTIASASLFAEEVAPPVPEEAKAIESRHEIRIGGQLVRYKATAGWLIMKNDEGKPIARFGYTAYVRDGIADPVRRPVLFGFNGGPGSSSIWLHMGILGPRRVVVDDPNFAPPPPTELVDNAYSVLDVTDIVMVDPVGTGYSKVLGDEKIENHWGVDQDIASVAKFIVEWVTVNARWRSPKFILGESYGGIRAPGLAYKLQTSHDMNINGVILVSPFMDFVAGGDGLGIDLAHALYLPGLAATAWYHDRIENRPASLTEFLSEVETFAMDEYMPAMMRGYVLPDDEKRAVAEKLGRYTGTSTDYWVRAGLRVSHERFLQELGRDGRVTTGRIDSRYEGPMLNPLAERMDYDPFFPAIGPAFTAGFKDYYRRELKVEVEDDYVVSAEAWLKWDWKHAAPGAPAMFAAPYPNVLPDMAHAMKMNPGLHVLVQQGYYDLATPYFTSLYYMKHLDIPAEARERIRVEMYEAGHMMYLHGPSREKYREDLAKFIRDADRVE